MVQKALKKKDTASKVTKGNRKAPKKAAPKKLAPRRKGAVTDAKILKRHSAALTSATEKLIASRVGHLELLKGNRREIEKAEREKKEKESKKKK
ncbi:conserved hypothetical protein [Geotrichum candidum]|uniref:Uncharacterized protein n=1 Tax=Geotrichum candidum TaxID=1173061 RepID=A0A0J9XB05_GEOCN|nr:conserved hypothetical protein [Geotrichum candidum]